MSELSDELKAIYSKTAQVLKGSERRQFMPRIVKTLGRGGQSYAAREFHWGRNTIRKGMQELTSGIPIQDNFAGRGRHKAEEQLPQLLDDLRMIVDGQSQTDPTFTSNRLYARLSAAEVRRHLIAHKGYAAETLPSEETIRVNQAQTTVELACYPPYHSKYNAIERVWGVLEKHWNGSLLDTCDTVLRFAQTLTFRGRLPTVQWLEKVYRWCM